MQSQTAPGSPLFRPRKSPLLPPEVPFTAPGSPLWKRVIRGDLWIAAPPGVDLLCPRKSPPLKGAMSFIDNKIRVYPPPEVPYSLRVFVASTSK